eukprot:g2105.t1
MMEQAARRMLDESCDHDDAFTESQDMALKVVPAIGATFSLFGSIFIIFTYFYIPRLQRIPYKLIMFMSCSDAMSAFSYLLGLAVNGDRGISCDRSTMCYIQAALSQYFEVSSMFWVLCVGMHIFIVMYVYKAEADASKLEHLTRTYHVIAWGMPAILLIIAMSADVFGDAGQWCWISADYQWARISLYYSWLILILMINCIMFYLIIERDPLNISQRSSPDSRTSFKRRNPLAFRLRLYLIAFVVTKIFSVINRIQNIADEENPIFALFLLQAIFEPFTGFANAAVYGGNKMVVNEYQKRFQESERVDRIRKFLASMFASSTDTTETKSGDVDRDVESSAGDSGASTKSDGRAFNKKHALKSRTSMDMTEEVELASPRIRADTESKTIAAATVVKDVETGSEASESS